MAKELSDRVPVLSDLDKDKWKKAEKLRDDFVRYYTIDRILDLELAGFVIGKGGRHPPPNRTDQSGFQSFSTAHNR